MHFAYPLPWWLAVLLAAAVGAVAYVEYRRPLSPLTAAQRGLLVALRVIALAAIVLFGFRPIAVLPPAGRAMRSCRSSSTSRAACASPTQTARRVSLAPTAF